MTRLKNVAVLVAGQSPPSAEVDELSGGQPFLQGNAEFGVTFPTARLQCAQPPKQCQTGDLLLSVRAPVGALNVADIEYGIGRGLCAIRPARIDSRFLWWWMIHSRIALQSVAVGSTFEAITAGVLGNTFVPDLSLHEQGGIADYLDRETARIDALIAKQSSLIGMLRLRKQAAIDQIVAGLANAVQLRRVIRFLTSGSRGWGDFYADNGERFVRIANLARGSLDVAGEVQLVDLPPGEIEGSRTRASDGDVVFSITAYLGSVGVIRGDWIDAYVSQHVALCRVDTTRLAPDFLGWVMLSTGGQDQLKQGAAGGTKQQLALDDIRGLLVPLPTLDVQQKVVKQIEDQVAKIDMLIAKADQVIALSRERRSALITAAVTGQIDVGAA